MKISKNVTNVDRLLSGQRPIRISPVIADQKSPASVRYRASEFNSDFGKRLFANHTFIFMRFKRMTPQEKVISAMQLFHLPDTHRSRHQTTQV